MKILFAAGGTGGHLTPAINLAAAFEKRIPSSEFFFFSTGRGIENRFLKEMKAQVVSLFPDTNSKPPISNPLSWFRAVRRAHNCFNSFRPDAVIATGGYILLPVIFKTVLSRTPLYLIEPNAVPGRATRLGMLSARHVFCHYENAAAKLGKRASFSGSPVAQAMANGKASREKARFFFGLESDRRTLLVVGGSLGASALNRIVIRNLDAFRRDHQILHITGEKDYKEVLSAYRKAGVASKILRFCGRMDLAYRAADLLFGRAGGMTVAESCASGLPSVLVPYPHHRDRHQFSNAKVVEKGGGGVVIDEKEAAEGRFRRVVIDLLGDDQRLYAMRNGSRKLGRPRAAERIVGTIGRDLGMSFGKNE